MCICIGSRARVFGSSVWVLVVLGCRVLVALGWVELCCWAVVCFSGPRVESLGREGFGSWVGDRVGLRLPCPIARVFFRRLSLSLLCHVVMTFFFLLFPLLSGLLLPVIPFMVFVWFVSA